MAGKKRLRRLQIREVGFVDAGGNGLADVVICKRRDPIPTNDDDNDTEESMFDLANIPEEFRKSVADALAAKDAEIAKLKTQAPANPAPSVDPEPEIPEAVAKHLEQQSQVIAKLKEQLEAKDKAEEIQKCAAYKGIEVANLGETMYVLKSRDSKLYEDIHQVLKAAAAVHAKAAKVLTKERGTTGGDAPADPFSKVEELAKAKVQSGECKTHAQAVAKVLRENPSLYTAYESARAPASIPANELEDDE